MLDVLQRSRAMLDVLHSMHTEQDGIAAEKSFLVLSAGKLKVALILLSTTLNLSYST